MPLGPIWFDALLGEIRITRRDAECWPEDIATIPLRCPTCFADQDWAGGAYHCPHCAFDTSDLSLLQLRTKDDRLIGEWFQWSYGEGRQMHFRAYGDNSKYIVEHTYSDLLDELFAEWIEKRIMTPEQATETKRVLLPITRKARVRLRGK